MTLYLDASIILRIILRQKGYLKNWKNWGHAYTNELTRVESLRTIDRLRLQASLTDEDVASSVEELEQILNQAETIKVESKILQKASQAFPTSIGTLDAIHLASALLLKEHNQKEITVLTHDKQMGRGAQALGMKAEGF